MQSDNIFDMYEKYVKETEPVIEVPDDDKLFEVEETPAQPETPQVVIPDNFKADLIAELKEQLLKELSKKED